MATLILAVAVTTAPRAQQRQTLPAAVVPQLSNLFSHSRLVPCQPQARAEQRLRIATWNIKAARASSLEAVAAEMRAMGADIVAVQEVDVRTRRSGDVDQPAALAAALAFQYAFAASIRWDDGDYGLALLSKWPLVAVERHRVGATDRAEPRIVLDATICVAGRPLRILNHHADDEPAARARGFADVRRILQTGAGRGLLMVGDMNEHADGPGLRTVRESGLVDLGARTGMSTSDGGRVDYVFADGPISRHASAARVWQTDKSDHHAVVADLRW
jgi:endonuclease/exonuclease/phosphatase family metal-dependent hydrolase